MAERQIKFETRLKESEKKQLAIEKKRRNEIRDKRAQILEKTIEADEKRDKVKKDGQTLDNKAYDDYKKGVKTKRDQIKSRFNT